MKNSVTAETAEITQNLLLLTSRLLDVLSWEFQSRATVQYITSVQMRVLWELNRPLTMSDVARVIGATRSAATSVVNGLVKRGFVIRTQNPANRREVWVKLSTDGEELRAEIRSRQLERLERVTGRLADADAEVVERAIGILNQAVRRERQSMKAGHRSVEPSLLVGATRFSTQVGGGESPAQGSTA